MRSSTIKLIFIFISQLAFINSSYSQYELREKDIQFGENWLEQVRVSVPNQDLLVATIVAQLHDSALASELFSKALESLEHDPVLLSLAILNCFSEDPINACQDNALFEELIRINPDNLEPYLYFMLRLAETGDTNRALQILNQGMEATQHNIYYEDTRDVVQSKLVALGYPQEEAIFPADVYANISPIYLMYVNVLSTCKAQSVLSNEWKLSCLFLGARLQHISYSLLSNVFGGAIQRDVLIAVEADEDVIQLVIEHNEWVTKIRDLLNEKAEWASRTATTLDQPNSFQKDRNETSEFNAILRAIYRTQ